MQDRPSNKPRDRHVMELDSAGPNLTWLELVEIYNGNKPENEPELTRQTAMRIHDESLFKIKLALRKQGIFKHE